MKVTDALDGPECWSQNFGTIHIQGVLRYLRDCIKRAAISAVQQPSPLATVLTFEKKGYGL
jgi:hypothetical protein